MTREEAKTVFLNRGYVEVEGGTIYDADKWRESYRVISEWLEQEPYDDVKYHEEHGEVVVDKAVWKDAKRALEQITKITDLLDGTIDHFDRDDAMDMLYEIKGGGVIK